MACSPLFKAHVNFNVSENINRSKFGFVKNGYFISDVNVAQVIENKDLPNFGLNENIGKLNFDFSENRAHVNFNVSENINQPKFGLVKTDIRSETCVEFSY